MMPDKKVTVQDLFSECLERAEALSYGIVVYCKGNFYGGYHIRDEQVINFVIDHRREMIILEFSPDIGVPQTGEKT